MSKMSRHGLGLATFFALAVLGGVAAQNNLSSLFQTTSFVIVFSTTLGVAVAVDGTNVWSGLKYAVVRKRRDKSDAVLLRTLDVLSKTSLLGGVVGTAIGLVHVVANFSRPEVIGPGIAVSVVCLTCSLFFNLAVILPAKLSVLSHSVQGSRWQSAVSSRLALAAGALTLAGVCLGAYLEGANLGWFVSIPGFLLAIVAPAVIWCVYGGIISETNRCRALMLLANSSICGALIAANFHLIHLMENLDKPAAIGLRAAFCLVPMIYGLAASYFLQLRSYGRPSLAPNSGAGALATPAEEPEASYLPFAAFASSVLVIVVAVTLFALDVHHR